MSRVPSLSVVLPAFNEQDNVATVVQRGLEVLPRLAEDFELIVVDDGSSDATAAVVRAISDQAYPNVRLISHPVNRGYGAAIRTGFEMARYELVFYTDSDNQFDLSELEYFLPLARDHDMVIGFRVYRYDTVVRSMLSWGYNRLVRVLFRVRVRDVDCAYKLLRREVLQKIDIQCENFFVDTELVAKARKWNFRIVEKGVRHYPRMAGETTVQASDVPRTLRAVVRMWKQIYWPSRRQRLRREGREKTAEKHAVEALPPKR